MSRQDMSMAVEVKGLVKIYGDLHAVDGISFTVQDGEIFAFLGPNGAGKTTTIEILQCLRRPTRGSVRVLGYDIAKASDVGEIKKRIGVLPQDFNALDRLTVRENILLFSRMFDEAKDPEELMSLLDLTEMAKMKFDELSGGLKQRVGLATALVNDPQLVFLDEPTSGLDPKSRRDVWNVIRGLKESGKTVFLTTHYMEEAEVLADRIAVINKGKIAAIGRTPELLEQYGGKRILVIKNIDGELGKAVTQKISKAQIVHNDIIVPADDMTNIAKTISILSRKGIKKDIQIHNPSIENVFLSLVRGRITEEGELA